MKTGQLIILSNEEYSDYSFTGPFRLTRDFTMREAIEATTSKKSPWKHGPNDVIQTLQELGWIEKLDCKEIHLGCYGNIEVENLDD